MHTVTVVIPAYNAENTIGAAINSILSQTFQDFEIIVVDDASHDSTIQIVKQIEDPRVRLLRHEKNLGPAAARNNALTNADSKWICMLDADDLLDPSYIDTMLANSSHGSTVFLASAVGVFSTRPPSTESHNTHANTSGKLSHRPPPSLSFVEFLNLGVDIKPFFPLAVARDNQLKQRGLGSEWLEFIADLFRCGLELVFINEPLYYYRVHSRNYSSRYEQVLQDIDACNRLLACDWLPVDARKALIARRVGYMRHRPWKALHRGMILQASKDFLRAPGSVLQGYALLRKEIEKHRAIRKDRREPERISW
jgi:glycosyltransferase involved in cell wall biosynthesis